MIWGHRHVLAAPADPPIEVTRDTLSEIAGFYRLLACRYSRRSRRSRRLNQESLGGILNAANQVTGGLTSQVTSGVQNYVDSLGRPVRSLV